jgi:hypothetical protein
VVGLNPEIGWRVNIVSTRFFSPSGILNSARLQPADDSEKAIV